MEIEKINVGKEEGLSELEKEHLASERCKNFMKVVREINSKLRDNPEAQKAQAKTLWYRSGRTARSTNCR